MARSDVIRADLDRIRSMPDQEFEAAWGEWGRSLDKDLRLVRERWIRDLEHALPYAEQEEDAVAVLVDAKEAYRYDPTEANKARKATAAAALRAIHDAERARNTRQRVAGDAYVTGV